jgi:hypothetical protein
MSINLALNMAAGELQRMSREQQYKCDIRAWAKDKLGLHIWSKQEEIAKALVEHGKVAVKSCHGSGKSYFASIVVAWWVDTRYGTGAVVVSTAPSAEQVAKVLWRYIREHHSKHDLIGYTTLQNEWKDDAGQELAWGRKPADTSVSTFQGIHSAGGVLAVLDEANGIVDALWTNVYAITTGAQDKILAIANPDVPTGEFARIFLKDDPDWYKITISAFDTPNFTGEYMPEEAKGGMISPKWVESRKRAWGEDSPRYKSKVLGEFSTDATNNLFSLGTLQKGCITELAISDTSTPVLGCDVARMGEDYSTVYSFQDGVLRFVDKWSKADAMETASRIVHHAFRLGAKEVRIDGVGLGGPVMDIVTYKSESRFETIGIIGNGASPDIDKWINARAYFYDNMRERMANGEIDIDINDVDLQEELGSLEYHFNNNRTSLQIEKKEEIRLKTGKSPDFADAAMYACAELLIDPTNPVSKLKPGETFEVDPSEWLFEWESQISPL